MTVTFDAFYTPRDLAAEMTTASSSSPKSVADFACGTGELLQAAASRWSEAELIGTDISRSALSSLKRSVRGVRAGRCDFLSATSRARSPLLRSAYGTLDLVLLNPPFTCRGGKTFEVKTALFNAHCGTAMAFVLQAFEYIKEEGELIVLLPAGSMHSLKDRSAWAQLHEKADVSFLNRLDHRTFTACSPTTILVRIRRLQRPTLSALQKGCDLLLPPRRIVQQHTSVIVHRGSIPMHLLAPGPTPLAHSDNLKNYRLVEDDKTTDSGRSCLTGPFVALPRVGQPRRDKVALRTGRSRIAISDCVIALACVDAAHAARLHSTLQEHWTQLAALYSGTGAKYITLGRLVLFLHTIGYQALPPADASSQMKLSLRSHMANAAHNHRGPAASGDTLADARSAAFDKHDAVVAGFPP